MKLKKIDSGLLITFEEFETMALDEKLLLLPLLPPKKRFEFLTDSRDAGALVRASPVVDLIVTLKEIGIEGAGALLSFCTAEQIQYFMDMDTWNGYSFDKNRMHNYLMVLREWDLDTLVNKFTGLDYEQQLIYLLNDFQVFLAREDFNPEEGIPEGTFTIDGLYYLKPNCDEEKFLLVKELMMLIFSSDKNLYFRLIEGMRQELYSNLEEDLYRFKSSRITELGFYEYEDAIGIYSEPTNIKREIIPPRIDPFSYSRLPVRYISDLDQIRSEIESIDDRTALEILFELQILINRAIIADKLEMFELESLEIASEKIKSMLRLGLDVIKKEQGITSEEAIRQYYVIDIFRHGYKKLKFIRDGARRILGIHRYLKLVELPLYFEGLLNIAQTNFAQINMKEIFSDALSEYPSSIAEIERLNELLLEIEASLDIIIQCYNVGINDIEESLRDIINIAPGSKPSFFNLLITPATNMILGREPLFKPLKIDEVEQLCKRSFIKEKEEIFLTEDFLKILEERLFSKIKGKPGYIYARRIMGRALEEYISELGYISDFSSITPELISVIALRKN